MRPAVHLFAPRLARTVRPPWTYVPHVVLAVFGVGYALQTATPLRLNGDVATYLTVAGQVLDGRGFVDAAGPTLYPPGYPALIALVSALGLDVSFALVGVNVVGLAVAVAAAVRVYRDGFGLSARASLAAAALVPASYVVVKHATLVIADVLFLAVATVAVAAMTQAARGGPRAGRALVGAAFAVGVAFALRTTAVALAPALAVAALVLAETSPVVRRRLAALRTRPLAVGAAVTGVLALAAWAFFHTRYGQDAIGVYARWGGAVLLNNVRFKLTEGGEIAFNAPSARWAGLGLPESALLVAGAIAALVVGAGLWTVRGRREAWPAVAYVVAFAAMLLLWPGFDARFWLGVWPVALGAGAVAVQGAPRPVRRVAQAAAAVFVTLGVLALGYSTQISLAGNDFPDRYAGGTLAPAYRAAWADEAPPDTSAVSLRAHGVLVRFGR